MELDRGIGLDVGIFLDTRLVAIRRHFLAIDDAFPVLPAHGVHGDVLTLYQPNGFQQLHLLLTHGIRVEGNWRLHGCERKQLQQVVGDHIAQRTRFFVVARAPADAERFGGGDFDVVNVVAIPDRLED